MSEQPSTVDDENTKLVTLARATWARMGGVDAAAVRDVDGRTYVACAVDLPSLTLSALQVAVATAVSSGATRLAAAAIVTESSTVDDSGVAALHDLNATAPVFIVNPGQPS